MTYRPAFPHIRGSLYSKNEFSNFLIKFSPNFVCSVTVRPRLPASQSKNFPFVSRGFFSHGSNSTDKYHYFTQSTMGTKSGSKEVSYVRVLHIMSHCLFEYLLWIWWTEQLHMLFEMGTGLFYVLPLYGGYIFFKNGWQDNFKKWQDNFKKFKVYSTTWIWILIEI